MLTHGDMAAFHAAKFQFTVPICHQVQGESSFLNKRVHARVAKIFLYKRERQG